MLNILKRFFYFFSKKDIIKNKNNSDFYSIVIYKGKEKMDSELFDRNSSRYLFR